MVRTRNGIRPQGLRGLIASGLLTLAGLTGWPAAHGSVTTTPLDWRAMTLEAGLDRVKSQFLGISAKNDTEFVGAVLKNASGAFTFTYGQGQPGQDQVTFRIQRPEDAELVGLWHTHGAEGPTRAVFSPTDAELVRRLGLPFYLITPDGEIRVLRPEHVADRRSGTRQKGSMARLPRGSHPGERLRGRGVPERAPRGCADVMEV